MAFSRGSILEQNSRARNRANYVNKQLLNAFDFCSLRVLVALTVNLIQIHVLGDSGLNNIPLLSCIVVKTG